MRRIFIFGLLGPTLGFLLAVGVAVAVGIPMSDAYLLLVILSYAFSTGIVPALLAAGVDWYLAARLTFAKRVLSTAGAAYLLCTLVGLTFLHRMLSIPAVLMFALVGMVVAAICSLLSGRPRISMEG